MYININIHIYMHIYMYIYLPIPLNGFDSLINIVAVRIATDETLESEQCFGCVNHAVEFALDVEHLWMRCSECVAVSVLQCI